MRLYRLGYAGPTAVGLAPLQIIASGRVKSVQFSVNAFVDGAVPYDTGAVQIGIASVSEFGETTSAPSNFAMVVASSTQTLAAADHVHAFNVEVPCDYPVTAGQMLVLNLAGLSQAGSNWESVDVFVWVA